MSRDIALSVVVTNYNYAEFVSQAVESVLGQHRPDVEVVVVDDGSADRSLQVLSSYATSIRLVIQGHRGMAAAFNAGFAASQGQWVMFLDADDVLLPGSCARILAAAAADVVRVQWRTVEVDIDLQPTGALVPSQPPTAGDVRALVAADGPFAVVNAHGCGTVWSREFLEGAMPIPATDFTRHCDAYLATLACVAGPSAVLDEPASLYRVHGNNDYAGRSRAEHYRRTLAVYKLRCQLLAQRTGLEPQRWLEGNPHYDWLIEVNRACTAIEGAIPPQSTYLLIDDDAWAAGGQLFDDRRNLAFSGTPVDDRAAARGLDAAIAAGATHCLVAPQASWWLDHYGSLRDRLQPIHSTENVTVCAISR